MFKTKVTSFITQEQRCLATSYLANLKWGPFQEQYSLALKDTLKRLELSSDVFSEGNLFKDPNAALNQLANFNILHPGHSDLKWLIKNLKEYISSKKDYSDTTYRVFTPADGEFHQHNGVKPKSRGQD